VRIDDRVCRAQRTTPEQLDPRSMRRQMRS
jgi:hypothetical protein